MKTSWTDWHMSDYHEDWLRQAANDRLARDCADDPAHYLPGDVAWVVNGFKALGRWFAAGLGNPPRTTTPPQYRVGKQQKHGV